MRIRHAIPDDLPALGVLAAKSFRSAFAADNAPADIDAYVSEAFATGTLERELADGRNVFLLALSEDDGDIAGYAKLRCGPADESVGGPEPLEIERLYVDPDSIGRGIGAALMRACLDEAAARGRRTVWLGVWVHNARAIAFYERWGFRTVGSRVFRLGADDQTDLVMERAVDQRPSPVTAAEPPPGRPRPRRP